MPTRRRKVPVPATPANCKKDRKAKEKIEKEFTDFNKLVRQEAKKSREVRELLGPLAKLKRTIIWGVAHGIYLASTPVPPPKKGEAVLTARGGHRAGRVK